jgi:hypothetical protein
MRDGTNKISDFAREPNFDHAEPRAQIVREVNSESAAQRRSEPENGGHKVIKGNIPKRANIWKR